MGSGSSSDLISVQGCDSQEGTHAAAAAREQRHAVPQEGHQVGGHGGGALLFDRGRVLKRVDEPKELAFFEFANGKSGGMLAQLTPKYYGLRQRGGAKYIVMEDVVARYSRPCIADMKMGTRTWHDECTPEKAEAHRRQDAGCTTSVYGFRFCGMKVLERRYDKKTFGWNLMTDREMVGGLRVFLSAADDTAAVARGLARRVAAVRAWAEHEGGWELVASSLLLVYEGDAQSSAEPSATMIDFAHATRKGPEFRDAGYITGLSSLERLLLATATTATPE
eukprot:m51a1_g9711 putative inositol polyphosphate multikinase alpha (279) ;mRNA; r:1404665-1405704